MKLIYYNIYMCLHRLFNHRLINKLFGNNRDKKIQQQPLIVEKFYYTTPEIRRKLLLRQMEYYGMKK